MAGSKRAFRRRLVWTLVTAVLAAATLTGCGGDKDQQPPPAPPAPQSTGSQPDKATILEELGRISMSWLNGFGEPSTADLGCPRSGYEVVVTGAGAADLKACLQSRGNRWSLRVRNQTGVPITISGAGVIWVWTVQPNATADIPFTTWRVGNSLTYKPNVAAGVMMALNDQLKDKRTPQVMKWLQCPSQGFEDCLVSQAPEFLPEKVRIGKVTVPVQQVAKLLTALWGQRDLARAFVGHATGEEGGTLTLRQAA